MSILNITLDGESYSTGGFSLDYENYVRHLEQVLVMDKDGYTFDYDEDNKKVLVFNPATTAEGAIEAPDFTGTEETLTGTVSQPTFTAGTTDAKHVSLDCGATGCANTDSENADAAADTTSADAVCAYADVASSEWTHGAITQPPVPRNVCVVIENDSGGALNLYEGDMTFTVTGKSYTGETITEDIVITSTSENKEVANTTFRHKFGSKAFASITNYTLDNVPDDGFSIGLGFGGKISLLGELATPDADDIIQIIEDGTVVADPSSNVDTTNMTYNFDTIAANKVVSMTYLTTTGATGTVSQPDLTMSAYTPEGSVSAPTFTGSVTATHDEVGNGTSLSISDISVIIIGE
jgi:hypothetical protein